MYFYVLRNFKKVPIIYKNDNLTKKSKILYPSVLVKDILYFFLLMYTLEVVIYILLKVFFQYLQDSNVEKKSFSLSGIKGEQDKYKISK